MSKTARQIEFETRLVQLRGGWRPQDYSARLLIPEARLAIAGDAHIPYHDERLLAEMLDRASQWGIEALVWLGDLLDLQTFSSWGQEDYTTEFERELQIAEGVIRMAAEVVAVQYWSLGNHEARLLRKNGHQFSFERMVRLLGVQDLLDEGRLIVSENPTIDADEGRWMLTHPASYGNTPLVVPGHLAQKHQQNVASAHAHHWGHGMDPTNTYEVIETGGLFRPEYHKYIQHRVTTHREWVQGYWFLTEGVATGFRGQRKVQRRVA